MNKPMTPLRRPGSGRLSADDAERLPDRLLDAAAAVFHEKGYAKASMDAIARLAGASTKTLYSRYRNKREILAASTRRMVDRALPPLVHDLGAGLDDADPREMLTAIALRVVHLVTGEQAIGMYCNVIAERKNLPELAGLYAEGSGRVQVLLTKLFERWQETGTLRLRITPHAAVACFIDLIVATPRNRAVLNMALTPSELEAHVAAGIAVFFDGCVAPGS